MFTCYYKILKFEELGERSYEIRVIDLGNWDLGGFGLFIVSWDVEMMGHLSCAVPCSIIRISDEDC